MEHIRADDPLHKQDSGYAETENRETERKIFPMNGLRVCIDGCEEELNGRFYSKLNRDALPFRNLGEFLLKADELFDARGYPQNFQEKRSFARNPIWSGRYAPPETARADEEIVNQQGKRCTLDIFVGSRRRASWQGVLMRRGRPRRDFQSARELLCLILEEAGGEDLVT